MRRAAGSASSRLYFWATVRGEGSVGIGRNWVVSSDRWRSPKLHPFRIQQQRLGTNATETPSAAAALDEDDDNEEWIPPSRPLVGDQGFPQMYPSTETPTDDDDLHRPSNDKNDNDDGDVQYENIPGVGRIFSMDLKEEDEEEKPQKKRLGGKTQGANQTDQHRAQAEETEGAEDQEEEADRLMKQYESQKEADRQNMMSQPTPSPTPEQPSVDWLKTRRSVLQGETDEESDGNADGIIKASRGAAAGLIPTKKHHLLTQDEIFTVLAAHGGVNLLHIPNSFNRMPTGVRGMILVTAPSNRHLHQMSEHLVKHLRARDLQSVGVPAAVHGAEGERGDPLEKWMLVHAGNYMVQILLEDMRRHLNLEDLWTGKDPIWDINPEDEEAVDEYVCRTNPVPPDYGPPISEWDTTLRHLEKNRYTARHKPVIPLSRKRPRHKDRGRRRRGAGRR